MSFRSITVSFILSGAICSTLTAQQNHVLVLDNVGEHVLVPHSPSLAASDAITVEYWVNFRNTTGFGRIGKSAPSDCQWDIGLNSSPNQSAFNLHGPPADVSQWDAPRNRWAHIAATWSKASGTSRVYIDGTLIKETAGASTDMLNRDFPLYIGHLPGFSNTQLYGMVDNLRIWNIERSQADIQSTMHVQYSTSDAAALPALMASYSFEDGATDATGRNNGQFVGGAGVKIDGSFIPTAAVEWTIAQGGNGSWFEIGVRDSSISYLDAVEAATAVGGHLASLTSSEENLRVYQLSLQTTGAWIRLPNWHWGPWIGARRATPAAPNFIWETGEPFSFAAWMPGGSNCGVTQPDSTTQDYVCMSNGCPTDTSPTWSDSENNEGARSFVIEWSADCNGDGIVDFTQVRHGTVLDADGDNIPDCCVSGGPCEPCPADLTRDGSIDGDDLARMLAAWGSTDASNDVDDDGLVNGQDLGLILAGWGYCTD